MISPPTMNSINAAILIVAGTAVYLLHPGRPAVALVAPGLGLMLLACTYHLRRHNRFVKHTVTSLTLLAALVASIPLKVVGGNWNVQQLLLLLMGLSCVIAVGVYVGTFLKERRLRNNTIFKDDL